MITVPIPEAYLLHKIIINSERKIKAEKDLNAILNLLKHIDMAKCKEILLTLTKKEKNIVRTFFDSHSN
jgi:hypothetical protein